MILVGPDKTSIGLFKERPAESSITFGNVLGSLGFNPLP